MQYNRMVLIFKTLKENLINMFMILKFDFLNGKQLMDVYSELDNEMY